MAIDYYPYQDMKTVMKIENVNIKMREGSMKTKIKDREMKTKTTTLRHFLVAWS